MGKLISLDWNENILYGFEDQKSDLVIASIIRGIELGDKFPPVPVVGGQGIYFLTRLRNKASDPRYSDGGHHRAIAHYIMNQPLKCELIGRRNYGHEGSDFIDIRSILIVDDSGEYYSYIKSDPNYRKIA